MKNKHENILEAMRSLAPHPENVKEENTACPMCNNEIKGFKDELSAKEYTISGLCQDCQDSFWG